MQVISLAQYFVISGMHRMVLGPRRHYHFRLGGSTNSGNGIISLICQLHGEAGEVDLEAIEPELIEIRQLCAQYTPDNIFNCDETGMYVKELDTKSYTTSLSTSGAKAIRDCRVSVMFCINASGTSLAMAKKKESLRPQVIVKVFMFCVSDFCLSDLDDMSFFRC